MDRYQEGHYIYFLVEKNENPPEWFYQFAVKFSLFQIKLLPVSMEQFLELTQQYNKSYLIVATYNFRTKFTMEKALNSYLGMAAKKGKLTLFHLSSFREVVGLMTYKNKRNYLYYKLPLDMDDLAKDIAKTYFTYQNQMEKWPGGRRNKLPNV